MGQLKSAMMDIGHTAMDIGIEDASKQYTMSEDDIKSCVLFAYGYDGNWEQFVSQGLWNDVGPTIH